MLPPILQRATVGRESPRHVESARVSFSPSSVLQALTATQSAAFDSAADRLHYCGGANK
jgi:hypothetical protein